MLRLVSPLTQKSMKKVIYSQDFEKCVKQAQCTDTGHSLKYLNAIRNFVALVLKCPI